MRTTIANKLVKRWEDQAVQTLAEDRDAAVNGRVRREDVLEAFESLQKMGSTITLQAFYKRVQRWRKRGTGEETPPPLNEVSIQEEDHHSAEVSALTEENQDQDDGSQKKAGRPKGTTNEKKLEELNKYKACINEVVRKYKAALDELKSDPSRKQLRKGVLSNLIQETKVKHGVEKDINPKTIRQRVLRRNLYPTHSGAVSPVFEEEKVLVVDGSRIPPCK